MDKVIYVTKFNPNGPNIKDIITKHTRILSQHPQTSHLDPNKFMVAYRRPKNLKDLLVHSSMGGPPTTTGTVPCAQPRCKTCQFIQSTTQFSSTRTGIIYHTIGHIDCSSTHVIYLITCNRCLKQYVGQTSQSLRTRMMQHRYNISCQDKYRPVSIHFNLPDHSITDFRVTGITTASRDTRQRLAQESAWIRLLSTWQPWGLNLTS